MRRLIFSGIAAIALLGGCSDAKNAEHVLYEAGYDDIEITGYSFFGCGEDDRFHTGFKAKSPRGHEVTGAVCSGILKSGTIRVD